MKPTSGAMRAASTIRAMIAPFGLTAKQLNELEPMIASMIDEETKAPEMIAYINEARAMFIVLSCLIEYDMKAPNSVKVCEEMASKGMALL